MSMAAPKVDPNGSADSKATMPSAESTRKLPEPLATLEVQLIAAVENHAAWESKTERVQKALKLERMKRYKDNTMKEERYLGATADNIRCARHQAKAKRTVLQLRGTILRAILDHKDGGSFMELVRINFKWEYMETEFGFPLFELVNEDESILSTLTRDALEMAIRTIETEKADVQETINETKKVVK